MSVLFHLADVKIRISSIETVSDVRAMNDGSGRFRFEVRLVGGNFSAFFYPSGELAVAVHAALITAIEEAL